MNNAHRRYLKSGWQAGRGYKLVIPREALSHRQGYHSGNTGGESTEFRDFRNYQPGDDLRHIDWRIYGRSDKLMLKLYQEEVTPHADILIDGSRSMTLKGTERLRAALGLAAFMGTSALNAKCTCRAWLAGSGCTEIENSSVHPSGWGQITFESDLILPEAFTILPPRWCRRGIRILLSDLLFPGDPQNMLSHMAEGASAVYIIQILTKTDLMPPFRGNVTVEDSETGETSELFFDEHMRQQYLAALDTHQQNWHNAALRNGALMVTFTAEDLVENWDMNPLEKNGILDIA